MKRILYTAAAVAISAAVFLPTQAVAQVGFQIVIGNAPPPPIYEAAPRPRRGHEWAPGYWAWTGRHHAWVPGHWERVRVGHYYQRPEWQRRHGGWQLVHGGWQPVQRPPQRSMHAHKPHNDHGRHNGHGKHNGHDRHDRHYAYPNPSRRH